MKTAEEILREEFANSFLDLEYIDLHISAMEKYAEQFKQKLNIASVSGKRPTRKLFCKVWTQTFGEEIDNVNQLVYGQAALGEDLYELCLKFHQSACASGAVDKTVSGGSCLKSCSPSDWQTKCKENGCNTE